MYFIFNKPNFKVSCMPNKGDRTLLNEVTGDGMVWRETVSAFHL